MTEVEIKHKIAVAILSRQMTKNGINESTEIIYKLLNELLTIQRVKQLMAFVEWKEYNGKWESYKDQVKQFLKEYKSN